MSFPPTQDMSAHSLLAHCTEMQYLYEISCVCVSMCVDGVAPGSSIAGSLVFEVSQSVLGD